MAVVQGIKERVHHPIYDSLNVEAGQQLRDAEATGILKFFVNVQGKTKLRTNLQSASLLPHYNTFEARALRVVISDQNPTFPDDVFVEDKDYDVVLPDDTLATGDGTTALTRDDAITADIKLSLRRVFELLVDARAAEDGYVDLEIDELAEAEPKKGAVNPERAVALLEAVSLGSTGSPAKPIDENMLSAAGATVPIHKIDLEGMIRNLPDRQQPPLQQLRLNDGAGTLIGKIIYNTVTTFYVGEKAMIQMPTFFFPAGAGPYSDTVKHVTHGEPTPLATFRFAEPIYIDRQQPFRVEIEVPDSETLSELQRVYGPFQIWVVLDGFMTRDVQ